MLRFFQAKSCCKQLGSAWRPFMRAWQPAHKKGNSSTSRKCTSVHLVSKWLSWNRARRRTDQARHAEVSSIVRRTSTIIRLAQVVLHCHIVHWKLYKRRIMSNERETLRWWRPYLARATHVPFRQDVIDFPLGARSRASAKTVSSQQRCSF